MQRNAGSVVTMGPDAEYTVHTNFTPSRTLLQTPIEQPWISIKVDFKFYRR